MTDDQRRIAELEQERADVCDVLRIPRDSKRLVQAAHRAYELADVTRLAQRRLLDDLGLLSDPTVRSRMAALDVG